MMWWVYDQRVFIDFWEISRPLEVERIIVTMTSYTCDHTFPGEKWIKVTSAVPMPTFVKTNYIKMKNIHWILQRDDSYSG